MFVSFLSAIPCAHLATSRGVEDTGFPSCSPLTHSLHMCTYMLRHAPPSARTSIARSYLLMDFFASLTHALQAARQHACGSHSSLDRGFQFLVKAFSATAGRRAGGFGIIVLVCFKRILCPFLPLTFIYQSF